MKQVYKITYPTGKIYIGKDSVGSNRYMGSPNPEIVNADFENLSEEQRRDYVIRKEILWESENATEAEVKAVQIIDSPYCAGGGNSYGSSSTPSSASRAA